MLATNLGNLNTTDESERNELRSNIASNMGKILVNNDGANVAANRLYAFNGEGDVNGSETCKALFQKNIQKFLVVFGEQDENTLERLKELKSRHKDNPLDTPEGLTIIYVPVNAAFGGLDEGKQKILKQMLIKYSKLPPKPKLYICSENPTCGIHAMKFLDNISKDEKYNDYKDQFTDLYIELSRPIKSNDKNFPWGILDYSNEKLPQIFKDKQKANKYNIKILYDEKRGLPVAKKPSEIFQYFLDLEKIHPLTFLRIDLDQLCKDLHSLPDEERKNELAALQKQRSQLKKFNKIGYSILANDPSYKITPRTFAAAEQPRLGNEGHNDIKVYELLADLVGDNTATKNTDSNYIAMRGLVDQLKKKKEENPLPSLYDDYTEDLDIPSVDSSNLLNSFLENFITTSKNPSDNPPGGPLPSSVLPPPNPNSNNKSQQTMGNYNPHEAVPKPSKSVEERVRSLEKKLLSKPPKLATLNTKPVSQTEIAHANAMLASIAKERAKAKEIEDKIVSASKPAKRQQTTQNNTYQQLSTTTLDQTPVSSAPRAVSQPKISPMQQQKQSYTADIAIMLLGLILTGAGTLGATGKIPLTKAANIALIAIGVLFTVATIADIINKKNIENKSTISLRNQQNQQQKA